jgi:hypothetical protein
MSFSAMGLQSTRALVVDTGIARVPRHRILAGVLLARRR